MRNLSFALTTEQIRNRTKTVTRRKGTWWSTVLEPGTLLCAVEKSQGIEKGELRRLCVIRVIDVHIEPLHSLSLNPAYDRWRVIEVEREGFPGMAAEEFVAMFCRHMRCKPDQIVTRIEFEYVEQILWDPCGRCMGVDPLLAGRAGLGAAHVDPHRHRHGLCPCDCHGEEAFR